MHLHWSSIPSRLSTVFVTLVAAGSDRLPDIRWGRRQRIASCSRVSELAWLLRVERLTFQVPSRFESTAGNSVYQRVQGNGNPSRTILGVGSPELEEADIDQTSVFDVGPDRAEYIPSAIIYRVKAGIVGRFIEPDPLRFRDSPSGNTPALLKWECRFKLKSYALVSRYPPRQSHGRGEV